MSSNQGTTLQPLQGAAGTTVSPDHNDYFVLGGHIYCLSTKGETFVSDRWDIRLDTWVPFDLSNGAPHDEAGRVSAAVDQSSTQSGPFAYHQGAKDTHPIIYTSALASREAPLAFMDADGRFRRQPTHNGRPGPLGQLLHSAGRLIAAERDVPRLWASPEPLNGEWISFGNPDWESHGAMRISHVLAHQGQIQVVLDNPDTGFEIWQSDDEGTNWVPVVLNGAYRYRRNAFVTAVTVHQGYRFLAASSVNADPFASGRTVGFELLVLGPSNRWDVLIGDCRCTPDGLRAPLLARGPGLDHTDDHRVVGLGCTADTLYLLTTHRRVWRLTENEVERLSIDNDLAPASLLERKGSVWLVLGSDGSMSLQPLS